MPEVGDGDPAAGDGCGTDDERREGRPSAGASDPPAVSRGLTTGTRDVQRVLALRGAPRQRGGRQHDQREQASDSDACGNAKSAARRQRSR